MRPLGPTDCEALVRAIETVIRSTADQMERTDLPIDGPAALRVVANSLRDARLRT